MSLDLDAIKARCDANHDHMQADKKTGEIVDSFDRSSFNAREIAAWDRYEDALHAMQSGVKYDLETGGVNGSQKHLRVGINSAMSGHYGLVKLLIEKGIFTREEWLEALADAMQREKKLYEELLTKRLGRPVELA